MEYFITFLEGVLTFISPCLLPMLPVYLTYMAGGAATEKRPVIRALAFVLGFSSVFILMGAAAAGFGRFVLKNSRAINLVGGFIVVIMGINFTGLFRIPLPDYPARVLRSVLPRDKGELKPSSFLSALAFGVIFALGWTPCVGAFLGPALTMAASTGTFSKGISLVCLYCVGLGLPFVFSALFIKELGNTFSFIKKHYGVINFLSGLFLIILGILMMMGKVSI